MIEFSRTLLLDKVAKTKNGVRFQAEPDELKALAERFHVPEIKNLTAEVFVTYDDQHHVFLLKGELSSDLVQSCVVSNNPLPISVVEPIEIVFLKSQKQFQELYENPVFDGADFEILEDEGVEIGEMIAQYLSLALPPFPRDPEVDLSSIEVKGFTLKKEEEAKTEMKKRNNPFSVLENLHKKS